MEPICFIYIYIYIEREREREIERQREEKRPIALNIRVNSFEQIASICKSLRAKCYKDIIMLKKYISNILKAQSIIPVTSYINSTASLVCKSMTGLKSHETQASELTKAARSSWDRIDGWVHHYIHIYKCIYMCVCVCVCVYVYVCL